MSKIFKELPGVMIHPQALVETDKIGKGTRVWAFTHLMEGAMIGENCNLCDHSFMESGAVLGNHVTVKNSIAIWDRVTVEDNVFLGPNMSFTNDMLPRVGFAKTRDDFLPTLVKKGASIGANATLICGITIGASAMIAAGAVVTKDVPDFALVMGNPARVQGHRCVCGQALSPEQPFCGGCGRKYHFEGNRVTLQSK